MSKELYQEILEMRDEARSALGLQVESEVKVLFHTLCGRVKALEDVLKLIS